MKFERSSGILLHPTSFPGPYGIGDIGPAAYQWIDFLTRARCGLWQVLPLGPTGYGDSPYQSFSAFAGNPYLISIDNLIADGLLTQDDVDERPAFPPDRVDYGLVIPWKMKILNCAYSKFLTGAKHTQKKSFEDFKTLNAGWLDDFALFMALKEVHRGDPWWLWEAPLRQREPAALENARRDMEGDIARHAFFQYLFIRQWKNLKDYAAAHHIRIIGDIPIFVAHDSAEVWASPAMFFLNKKGQPTVQAGVPPDYFSPTGQLWGNPLYRWSEHKKTGYAWWIQRFRSVFTQVDIVRLDHFRGFAGYWEVPGQESTAMNGRWVPGPGKDFLKSIQAALGDLPIIAEDLGVITPDVVELRQSFKLPGMKILVFAFDEGPDDPDLPHQHTTDSVVYTGTHDNDTVWGWYQRVDEKERDFARRYLRTDAHDLAWDLIRTAWASVAIFALAPLQDILNLDNRARMNYPSRPDGNWQWRMPPDALNDVISVRIAELNWLYGRSPAEDQDNYRPGLYAMDI